MKISKLILNKKGEETIDEVREAFPLESSENLYTQE